MSNSDSDMKKNMTDGIIQEVLNPEIKFWTQQKSMCAGIIATELSIIRQELIEKIKQEVDKMQMSIIYRDGLKRVLIGDNKE